MTNFKIYALIPTLKIYEQTKFVKNTNNKSKISTIFILNYHVHQTSIRRIITSNKWYNVQVFNVHPEQLQKNINSYQTCEKCIEIDLKAVFPRAARLDSPLPQAVARDRVKWGLFI